MNFLDRNEFNFEPSEKVIEAIKNFDPRTLCFYTRIYDQGKKSVISVRLSEIYNVPEDQVLLGYGGEEMLKNAIHYFLMEGDNKTILIPEFSWWYYNRVAGECGGSFEMYPLYETGDTFAYDTTANKDKAEREAAAADKLFSHLPPEQGSEIRLLWEEFDEMKTPDSKYAACMDRLQPFLHNTLTQGHTWKEGNTNRAAVEKRMSIIKDFMPEVYKWIDQNLDLAIERGWLNP